MVGRPPDFLAFVITVLMMLLMAAGVKKSLVFNNVLNAVNLSVWVFVMTAGLFYVDTSNWSEHKGFLPHGWPGVSGCKCKNRCVVVMNTLKKALCSGLGAMANLMEAPCSFSLP